MAYFKTVRPTLNMKQVHKLVDETISKARSSCLNAALAMWKKWRRAKSSFNKRQQEQQKQLDRERRALEEEKKAEAERLLMSMKTKKLIVKVNARKLKEARKKNRKSRF